MDVSPDIKFALGSRWMIDNCPLTLALRAALVTHPEHTSSLQIVHDDWIVAAERFLVPGQMIDTALEHVQHVTETASALNSIVPGACEL